LGKIVRKPPGGFFDSHCISKDRSCAVVKKLSAFVCAVDSHVTASPAERETQWCRLHGVFCFSWVVDVSSPRWRLPGDTATSFCCCSPWLLPAAYISQSATEYHLTSRAEVLCQTDVILTSNLPNVY